MSGSQPVTKLMAELRSRADALGFDAFGVAPANARTDLSEKLATALERNWHGDMEWMAETANRRAMPNALWPQARSVIMLGVNYGPEDDPLPLLEEKSKGNISVYARNRDYHDIIKGKLKELAGLLARRAGAQVKVFVDTAPVMEKPLAEAAGLGWQGKHTVLVSREFGSWLFLGAIFTDAALPADDPHPESCGTCTKCLDICPTDAFPAPFQLDARKCIAYLNIELRDQIPRQFRAPMGNRIYGCDDCLAICPWNKFATQTREAKLKARLDLTTPDLAQLVALDDAHFRKLFAASPIKRLGRDRFVRNVLIAIGNSANVELRPSAKARLDDDNPLVRGAAIWATRRLSNSDEHHDELENLRAAHVDKERNNQVKSEWEGDLTPAL